MKSLPTFDEAIESFRVFAESQHAPSYISFIGPEDIVVTGRHATVRRPRGDIRLREARECFEAAMLAEMGVLIGGLAASKVELFCFVYRPVNREDAEARLMSAGVKYSLRNPLLVAQNAGFLLWRLLRWHERSDPVAREWKQDTFGRAA